MAELYRQIRRERPLRGAARGGGGGVLPGGGGRGPGECSEREQDKIR